MAENKWESMNTGEFDDLLESGIVDAPPEEIIHEITPWRKAMNRVLIGMALCGITLNFLGLNYILPTIGTVLALLGYRTLHKENKWFLGCYLLTLLRTVYLIPSLILGATIYHPTEGASISTALSVANLAVIFLSLMFLWRGFLAVQRKAELSAHASGAAGMLVWYAVMCILAVMQAQGLVIGIIMIIAYVLLIRSLFKLSKELDETGYSIKPAAVRVSDRGVSIGIAAVLAIGLACAYLWGGSFRMDWTPQMTSDTSEVIEIREHLLSLGFPEAVLDDLTEEDILACKGALRIVVDETDEPLNEGREVTTQSGNHYSTRTVYDARELHITGIGVEFAGQREQWKLFHHFRFTDDTKFHGTESIQLWPTHRNLDGWDKASDVTGQVLCTQDGQRLAAPYASLGEETYTTSSIFWGASTTNDFFAEFSMPNGASARSGYLTYTVKEMEDGWIIDSWVNYTHQTTWLQYPIVTAKEKRMAGGWNRDGAFLTVQDALQFYPNDEIPTPFS